MYQKFFHADNPFWRGMGRLVDVVILNTLWVLCSIPIFTIGPASTAFFESMLKLTCGEETSPSKDFFHSFRRNFRQRVFTGLLLLAVGGFLSADVYISYKSGTGIFTFFMVFFFVLLLVWVFVCIYTLPLLAKFDCRTKDILILAFTLSIRNLPKTLLMLFLTIVALWLCHLAPPLLFFIFGPLVEFQSILFTAIFRRCLSKPDSMIESAGVPT